LLKRDFVLVVVDTADGQRGFAPAGASSSSMREFFEDASKTSFTDVIETEIAATLEGKTIEDPKGAHELLDDADVPKAIWSEAVGAIDVALYDI
jgi:L-alanine-DL-glutamate epimerase-like enolase superfamily enzyme